MKLDFLDDLTDNGKYPQADPDKLLRLYDFNSSEARLLKELIDTVLISQGRELDLSKLNFIQALNCYLKFQLFAQDFGIAVSGNNKEFVCKLTLRSYDQMCDIIDVFAKNDDLNAYNWLYDPAEGKVDLLFSPGGTW